MWVALPGHHPWPQVQGGSSWPWPLALNAGWLLWFLCHRSMALSAAAPDLGRGVAPLGRGRRLSQPLALSALAVALTAAGFNNT